MQIIDFRKKLYKYNKRDFEIFTYNNIVYKMLLNCSMEAIRIQQKYYPNETDSDKIETLQLSIFNQLSPVAKFIKSHPEDLYECNTYIHYKIEASYVYTGKVQDKSKSVRYEFKDKGIDCYGKKINSGKSGILVFIRYFTFSEYALHEIYISPIVFIPTSSVVEELREAVNINFDNIKFAYPSLCTIPNLIPKSTKIYGVSKDLPNDINSTIFNAIKSNNYSTITDIYKELTEKTDVKGS